MCRVRNVIRPLTIALLIAGSFFNQVHAKTDTDCSGLELQAASGVPDGSVHKYKFKGSCNVLDIREGRTYATPVFAEARATWDEKTQTLEETLSVTGSFGKNSGEIKSELKCEKDPIVYNTWCVVLVHENMTDVKAFSNAVLEQKRPILKSKTTLKLATQLSLQGKISSIATTLPGKGAPPPPSGKILASPSASSPFAGTPTAASQAQATGSALAIQGRDAPPSSGKSLASTSAGSPAFSSRAASPAPVATMSVATVERELGAASCTRVGTEGLRFNCATRSGFERCESLRQQRRVEQCGSPR